MLKKLDKVHDLLVTYLLQKEKRIYYTYIKKITHYRKCFAGP